MSSHRHDATHLDPDEDRGDEVMDTQLATQTNNAPFVSKTIWNEIIGIIVREQIQTEDHVQMRTVFFLSNKEQLIVREPFSVSAQIREFMQPREQKRFDGGFR